MEKKLYSKKRCTASFFAIPGAWSTFQAPGRNSARARRPPAPLPALGATLRQVPGEEPQDPKKRGCTASFFRAAPKAAERDSARARRPPAPVPALGAPLQQVPGEDPQGQDAEQLAQDLQGGRLVIEEGELRPQEKIGRNSLAQEAE